MAFPLKPHNYEGIDGKLRKAVQEALNTGWSQRKIERACGLAQGTLSHWRAGRAGLGLPAAEALCRFFGCYLSPVVQPNVKKFEEPNGGDQEKHIRKT